MATNYKVLGQALPSSSSADLYTVPSNTQAVISTLHVTNITESDAYFSVNVRVNGASAADSNSIAKKVILSPNSFIPVTTGITLDAGDIVTVSATPASSVSFSLFGSEVN